MNKATKVFIRQIKLGDLTQVIVVNEASLAENYPRGLWLNKFPESKQYSYVAVVLNQIIGYVFSTGDMIISIAVLEKYRGKGIGRELMKHCLCSRTNQTTQPNKIRLHVRVTNANAVALYTSLGFVIAGQMADYYINPTCDAHEMICDLSKAEQFKPVSRFNI